MWFDFHPWDWILHFGLSFFSVKFKFCTWWIALSVGIGVEYEQKTSIYYNDMSWGEYVTEAAGGDLIADCLGVGFAYYLNHKHKDELKPVLDLSTGE